MFLFSGNVCFSEIIASLWLWTGVKCTWNAESRTIFQLFDTISIVWFIFCFKLSWFWEITSLIYLNFLPVTILLRFNWDKNCRMRWMQKQFEARLFEWNISSFLFLLLFKYMFKIKRITKYGQHNFTIDYWVFRFVLLRTVHSDGCRLDVFSAHLAYMKFSKPLTNNYCTWHRTEKTLIKQLFGLTSIFK